MLTFHASSINKEKRNERRKVGLYNMKRRMAARLCRRQNGSTADHMMTPELTYSSYTSPSVLKTHTQGHTKSQEGVTLGSLIIAVNRRAHRTVNTRANTLLGLLRANYNLKIAFLDTSCYIWALGSPRWYENWLWGLLPHNRLSLQHCKVGSDRILQPQRETPACTALFLTLKVREKVPVNCWVPETRLQLHQDQRGPSFTPWERERSQYSAYCSPPPRLSRKGHKETSRGKGNTLPWLKCRLHGCMCLSKV